ncbi:type II secretion system F family protein [Candidatus Curtissbacteria bacterium]|nr:type II secretion system F family protein [Candidatus Curtissbacteria bacterium]
MKNLKRVRIKNSDKLNMFAELRTMLTAGLPILGVVDLLAEDAKGGLKIFLDTLKEDISGGRTISSTMAKFPAAFDKVTTSVVKAAEESGTLESSLKDIQTNLHKEIQFNDKIRSAALYPVIVFVVFLLVILVILTFVIPKISTVFTALKIPLPLPTKILIFFSNAVLYHLIYVLGILGAIMAASAFVYFRKREWLTKFFFSIPLISGLVRQIDWARFSRALSLLLDAGLPIVTSLDLAKEVVVKKEVHKIIAEASDMIASGKQLSESFNKYRKIVPKIMIKLIESGEKTGSLGESMQYVSEHMDYQVEKKLATVTALLEPALLLLIGLVVGAIMLSIIGPIYSLIGQIGPK